jgi:hypothetical protein
MAAQAFSITDFYLKLEKSTNKETAEVVSKAIELMEQKHAQERIEIKEEILKEIKIDDLATKHDLKNLEMTLKSEVEILRAEIERSKSSTIAWLCGFIVAWTGVLSAIFFHFSK